jgi:hypothetical protein
MKSTNFWDVAPCRSCVNRRFGGMYRLHLQGRKICKRETSMSRWRWRRYIPPKRQFTQVLHSATSQKTAFFFVFLCLVISQILWGLFLVLPETQCRPFIIFQYLLNFDLVLRYFWSSRTDICTATTIFMSSARNHYHTTEIFGDWYNQNHARYSIIVFYFLASLFHMLLIVF